MSYNDPTHWRGCAEDMRDLAERMKDGLSKHIMHRIAGDYERLAQAAEQRAQVFPRGPEVAPPNLRLFGYRRNPASTPLAEFTDLEIPSFLKRGPSTSEVARISARPTAHPGTIATTTGESQKAEFQHAPLAIDEVEACISAIEKAMGLPPVASHMPPEAIREIGCRAIAQATENNPP